MIQNTQIIVRYMYVHVNCHLLQLNTIWISSSELIAFGKNNHDAHYFRNTLQFGSFQRSSVYKVIICFHNKKW